MSGRPREAIILAGGKAERLGEAAEGRPKALLTIAGHPLAGYQIGLLAGAGVRRIIVSCRADHQKLFESELRYAGIEVACAPETEPLGRGGGIRFAASFREEGGPLFVMNGDELLAVELDRLLTRHLETSAAATITVARPPSPFGVVELTEDDRVLSFREGATLSHWVSAGTYVLGEEAISALPERGDHETTTFPRLAAEGRLAAFRYEGTWVTVNTPKDLRQARDFVAANPGWLSPPGTQPNGP